MLKHVWKKQSAVVWYKSFRRKQEPEVKSK